MVRVCLKTEAQTTESSWKEDNCKNYNTHKLIFGLSLSIYKIYDKTKTEYRIRVSYIFILTSTDGFHCACFTYHILCRFW
jgi:hypothetical protein